MKSHKNAARLAALLLMLGLVGCNSNPPRQALCNPPEGHNLEQAMSAARFDLQTGCEVEFDSYFQRLLAIGEGDPKKDNKAQFSDFLLWTNESGLQSKRQARQVYNRYFGVKYVSLMADYSVCSDTCRDKSRVLSDMRQELSDKERGLLKVSADPLSYQRALQLYRETELVLQATCSACGPLE